MPNYDDIFDWYSSARSNHIGAKEINDFLTMLAPGSTILDLGCGNGIPITSILIENGFKVFAIDSSVRMVDQFRINFSQVPVRCEQMQNSDFFNEQFDAVISYGVIFHLTTTDQEKVIDKVAGSLKPGGHFLFSSQKDAIEGNSTMNGFSFPYISLGYTGYEALLRRNDMRLLQAFFDEGDNYVYVSQKIS